MLHLVRQAAASCYLQNLNRTLVCRDPNILKDIGRKIEGFFTAIRIEVGS